MPDSWTPENVPSNTGLWCLRRVTPVPPETGAFLYYSEHMFYRDLKKQLSTLLADSSPNFFTEEERERAINLACIRINQESGFLR